MRTKLVAAALALLWAANAIAGGAITVPLQKERAWDFPDAGVHFDCNFSMARLESCERTADGDSRVLISPENRPINPSPWYAFKVRSDKKQSITVRFVYTAEGPRGVPWFSRDGQEWSRVEKKQFTRSPQTNEASVRLDVGPGTLWVASWPIVDDRQINDWMDKICRLPFAHRETAGESIEGRPLRAFVLGATNSRDYVFVIGRQHPPEYTGTIGLESFVDTVAGNSSLARKFRRRFQIAVLPLVNPDGVEHGHWRSNLGGVDLNRDWTAFSQPETRQTRDWLLHFLNAPGSRAELFIDFHSTSTNVFYAVPEQPDDANAGFTDSWLAGLRHDCPGFGFERDDAHNSTEATSKAWAHGHIHAPSITCEFGYATDRKLVAKAGKAEAEEMMRLLLAKAEPTAGE